MKRLFPSLSFSVLPKEKEKSPFPSLFSHTLFRKKRRKEKKKMFIPKNIQKDSSKNNALLNVERKLEPSPLSFSFSPSSQEKLKEYGKLYKDSLPAERRERREVEKKVGKARGKRGKGKGCE